LDYTLACSCLGRDEFPVNKGYCKSCKKEKNNNRSSSSSRSSRSSSSSSRSSSSSSSISSIGGWICCSVRVATSPSSCEVFCSPMFKERCPLVLLTVHNRNTV
jgi:hypothetical protein